MWSKTYYLGHLSIKNTDYLWKTNVVNDPPSYRLVAGIEDAVVADQFYDKSNWCIVLQKT